VSIRLTPSLIHIGSTTTELWSKDRQIPEQDGPENEVATELSINCDKACA